MGAFILVFALLIIGIVLIVLSNVFYWDDDCIFGFLITVVSTIALTIMSMYCIVVHVRRDIDYEQRYYQKQVLEYRIEHYEDNIVGNELLYNDVVEFNNKLRDYKRHNKMFFTNWFTCDKIAQIDYIVIPEMEEST